MQIQLTKSKKVFNGCEPYIIAEIGSNHNGDMELAKKLILEAKRANADCVKFQSWTKDSIFSKETYDKNFFLKDDYRQREDFTLKEIVDRFSISEKQLLEMKSFCDEVGIDCTSTPFSKDEVDFLVDKLKTPFIKVASMDCNNFPFLDYIARKGLPIVISTGLSELHEIDRAVRTIENAGNEQIVILHCVAIYPPKDEEINLNNISTLKAVYPYPIGFSDHSIGIAVPLASVAKEVCIIEKHFTLDKEMFGWDHKVSADALELEAIVSGSKKIAKAMGTGRVRSVESDERKREFRRSIVLTKNLKKGECVTSEMIDFKRPGTGISPEYSNVVIGRKAASDLLADYPIKWEDFE